MQGVSCIHTVAVCTLGCKVNQYDTDTLLAALSAKGAVVKDFSEPVQLYIINTCTVTQTGDSKSRQMIRRARRQNPGALVAACGCLSKLEAEAVRVCGADFTFDARDADSLFTQLTQRGYTVEAAETPCNGGEKSRFACGEKSRRTRSYIKIQEGCDNYCAYCIVPYARGSVVSRLPADIMAEAAVCLQNGAREIVLTGIHVASYGKDLGTHTLPDLLTDIAALAPERIRLGSLDPRVADSSFISTLRRLLNLCGHFHLSLQSGCDRTLQRMNRRYTAAEYADAAQRIREARSDAALTTDIIVGFPGETDADFEESLQFVASMRFARAHVFEYSPRAGTPAATFAEQIAPSVKAERGKRMRAVAQASAQDYLQKYIGMTLPVLFETIKDGFWEGHTANYIKVRVKTNANLFNTLTAVRLNITSPDGTMEGTVTALNN